MFRRVVLLIAVTMFSSNAFAACYREPSGRMVCGEGAEAGGYNPRTGTAWKSETNARGVTTTETNRGGEAVTKDGVGAVKTPGGKTCVKTRFNRGCN